MPPVNMVHIHHEGGGAPCTAAQCERFRHGGYCYGIGTDTFARWLAPADNYATADWNGRDLTLCFSGDRHTGYDVSDHDLVVLHNAFVDSYNRGEVTADPEVVAHRNAGGSNATACPGDRAMRRWNDIAVQCRISAPPGPTLEDMMQSATTLKENKQAETFTLNPDGTIFHKWRNPGGAWSDWVKLGDGFDGGLSAWTNANGCIEVIAHHKEHGYRHIWQTAPNNGWSDWHPL